MVNKKIIDLIWALPIYPVSWEIQDIKNYKSGILFTIIKNNKPKTISLQDQGSNYDIEVFNSFSVREYYISGIEPEDVVDEIDDYINGNNT